MHTTARTDYKLFAKILLKTIIRCKTFRLNHLLRGSHNVKTLSINVTF